MGANAGDALSICQRTSSDCNPSYFKDQEPIHLVDMDAYWIDATEVTNAMYTECVHAGRCQPPFRSESATRSDYFNNPQYADYPVIYVSWNDANTYCSWVGGRLPTEAEWEEAARGTEGRTYPWGNATPSCSLANVRLNTGDYCVGDTSRVGAYPAGTSPYNALDMSGNLWEWVNDWYSPLYYGSSPSANPTGPSSGEERVLRGGSWLNREWQLGSAYRFSNKPDDRNKVNYGFRCAADP
jgi:formylglycine-generating enzyme required for sulfatase activity